MIQYKKAIQRLPDCFFYVVMGHSILNTDITCSSSRIVTASPVVIHVGLLHYLFALPAHK